MDVRTSAAVSLKSVYFVTFLSQRSTHLRAIPHSDRKVALCSLSL